MEKHSGENEAVKAVLGRLSKGKLIVIAVLLIVALLSATVVRASVSSVQSHHGAISTLDEKKANATGLLAASASSAATISLLTGERGEPIADKLMDLSACFLFILAVLYLEKYLLIILGTVLFGAVIPLACGLGIASLLNPDWKKLRNLGAKIALIGMVIYCLIPAGVWVSNVIDDTYQATLDAVINDASKTEEAVSEEENTEGEEKTSLWNRVTGAFSGLVDSAKGALSWAKETLSRFIEAIAVMLVTTCIVPLLPIVAGVALIRWLFGVNVNISSLDVRKWRHKVQPARVETPHEPSNLQ